MALTNFILTVVGVSAAVLILRSDVRHSSAIFRRNIRQIRNWLEEESVSSSSKYILPSLSFQLPIWFLSVNYVFFKINHSIQLEKN